MQGTGIVRVEFNLTINVHYFYRTCAVLFTNFGKFPRLDGFFEILLVFY